MNNTDTTRELRNSVGALGNLNSFSNAMSTLKDVQSHIEHLENIGAKEEAHIVRHQVAIALRDLEATDETREQFVAELRSTAGKRAIEIANSPARRVNN